MLLTAGPTVRGLRDDAGAFFIVLPVGVGVGRVSETRHVYLRIEDQRRKAYTLLYSRCGWPRLLHPLMAAVADGGRGCGGVYHLFIR